MDRRPLAVLLAFGLLAVPGPATAASLDEMLAGAPTSGTLSDDPADVAVTAQKQRGTLGETPAETKSSSSSSTKASAGGSDDPAAAALPFTGSDPRITLLLGVAALLAGAGLRLRTGDARDF